jgi:dimethylargininase
VARLVAIVREPSASLAACELSFLDRAPIDLARACAQHASYRAALRDAGAEVQVLPPLDHLPDATFVEDTAVVVDELAVLGVPGTASRAPESEAIAPALAAFRPLRQLEASEATLEGGDVLRLGRTLYVGLSRRTNARGIAELRAMLEPMGYRIRVVPVEACLHLKTACSVAGETVVVLNPAWVDAEVFQRDGLETVAIDPEEPWVANVLLVGTTLLVPAGNPGTLRRLRGAGLDPVEVAITELQKAEAGLTCLSLVLTHPDIVGTA